VIEPLAEILGRFELQHAGPLTASEARRLGVGAVERLVQADVLRACPPATRIRNNECDHGCAMEPEVVTHAKTGERFGVHRCLHGGCGLVRIPLDDLRQWDLDLRDLAAVVARATKAGGKVCVDVPDRLLEVGRVVLGETARDVFVARGLAWDDAAAVLVDAARLKAAGSPLVLPLGDLPRRNIWPECDPAVALLGDVASLADNGLQIDLVGVVDRPTKPHASIIESKWITVTEAAKLLIQDLPWLDIKKARARVSKAANAKHFETNGLERTDRLIDRGSFSTWRLSQRDRDLAKDDANL
jgi:hypothetical protein